MSNWQVRVARGDVAAVDTKQGQDAVEDRVIVNEQSQVTLRQHLDKAASGNAARVRELLQAYLYVSSDKDRATTKKALRKALGDTIPFLDEAAKDFHAGQILFSIDEAWRKTDKNAGATVNHTSRFQPNVSRAH